jgi:hypothetical protein
MDKNVCVWEVAPSVVQYAGEKNKKIKMKFLD